LFVYMAALEAGYHPGRSSMTRRSRSTAGLAQHNGRYSGRSVRGAFAFSVNTVAVRRPQVGTRAVADMAQRFGITTRIRPIPDGLGSTIQLIDMVPPMRRWRGQVAVTPGIGRVTPTAPCSTSIRPTSRGCWSRLGGGGDDRIAGVVDHGTGPPPTRRPTAGKTGTTSTRTAGSSVSRAGSTTGVWFGRDDNRALPGLADGRARRALHDFMIRAVANRPPSRARPPPPAGMQVKAR
jgi:penicillin-binding protein 1A